MRIKKGDIVKILRGKDRGKSGPVINVFPEAEKVTIENINTFKKRVKPSRQRKQGETVLVARPMAVSNVQMICGSCKKATRIGMRKEGDKKVRYCKKCNASFA